MVTADEMAAFQLGKAALAEAARARRQANGERAARVAARRLRQVFGARRVWLVGSLVDGGFGEESDIDLVVEGLDEPGRCRARADLERLVEYPVDLLLHEALPPRLAQLVAERGTVLDEND